ncbi:MAG: hypothetical protein K0Q93_2583 [Nocardioidaceae bacterium]|jgi:hypothetical protein|nr:hypothetical protein [Nocardioidaceae bacterium]
MTASATALRRLALLRMAAQGIVGEGFATAADAVDRLTCVQAQDFGGALTSIALRVRDGSRSTVEAALDSGAVVRSWPMRGTLHFVPARDLHWLLALGAPRTIAATAKRRRDLGISDADLDIVRASTQEALAGGVALERADLLSHWSASGQPTAGQRGSHLISQLAMTGVICHGPVRHGRQCLVLVDEWIPAPRRLGHDLDREQALAEWALRYFRSHGPATVKDFTWWTRLLAADVRAAVALARPCLESLRVDGNEYLMDPATPDTLAAAGREARGVVLLPGFDEFVLGYADRTAALAAELSPRVCPGGNGMFLGTVVDGGRIVGTWRRTRRPPRGTIEATPFSTFSRRVRAALPDAGTALERAAAGTA